MFAGLAESTMSRDDGWRFLAAGAEPRAGRHDRTPAVRPVRRELGQAGWVTTLRCCGAYEAYLRTYQRAVDVSLAAEFLVLDRLFPRSVFSALRAAEECLAELDPSFGRAGLDDPARRNLGQARTELEFCSGDDCGRPPRAPLPLAAACFDAGTRDRGRYFRGDRPAGVEHMSWRLGIRHTSAYSYARMWSRPTTRSASRRSPPSVRSRSTLGSRSRPRSPCQLLGLLGDARPRLRHPRPPPRARRGRILHRRDPRLPCPDRTPRDRAGPSSTLDAVGEAYFEYLAPTAATAADDGLDARSADPPQGGVRTPAPTHSRLVGEWVHAALVYERGSTERVDLRDGRMEERPRRVPGLRPPGDRHAAEHGHPRPLRVRVLPPAGGRRDRRHGDGESHAWCEAWTGDWRPFDPTNAVAVGRTPRAGRPRSRLPRRPTAARASSAGRHRPRRRSRSSSPATPDTPPERRRSR